jgi:ABC-2 type transport system ATP-binding protein
VTASQATAPAIYVHGLEKSYKELEVLRGVDFEVACGNIFALLGSNGAGKTTLVRILSTLLKADAGTTRVNGFDVATQPADVRESISLTGQFAAVDEILSGRENLVLVAHLRHLKDPSTVADGLLHRFSLADAAARRAVTYSGGMRRRLDIAMSLIGKSAGHLPRRADRRARPPGAYRGVAGRQGTRRAGQDGAAHDAVPGRGRTTR